jgi:hypothetical protein
MGSRRTISPSPPPIPQPTQNALVFQNGQAYNRTGGMNADSKKGIEASPFQYKPMGFTAQEAGYFGPGRYGAAKRYGEDSVTNPNAPQLGNYYPAQAGAGARQAQTVFLDPVKSKGSPTKVPMSAGMYGGLY